MSLKNAVKVVATELSFLPSVRAALLALALKPLPSGYAGRIRASVYRSLGWRIGSKSLILGPFEFLSPKTARRNLTVGESCIVNAHVYVDTTAPVTFGNGVGIGHNVVIITADHEIGERSMRLGAIEPRPVIVGDGAWIAARATIMPGVTNGEGAVVAAGALVKHDVPAHCVVAGVPARVIRELTTEELGVEA